MSCRAVFLLAACLPGISGALPPAMADEVAGPLRAAVLRVIDGDSLEIRARVWLGMDVTVQVRVRGMDAPELRGRCAAEKKLARRARSHLAALAGETVFLSAVTKDKYGGRVTADVMSERGEDIAGAMIAAGLGRVYAGGRRAGWCGRARSG